jgi:hypothetical protein
MGRHAMALLMRFVGLTQGLLAKKTIGGRDKGVEAYIGDFTHPAKPHIAAHAVTQAELHMNNAALRPFD